MRKSVQRIAVWLPAYLVLALLVLVGHWYISLDRTLNPHPAVPNQADPEPDHLARVVELAAAYLSEEGVPPERVDALQEWAMRRRHVTAWDFRSLRDDKPYELLKANGPGLPWIAEHEGEQGRRFVYKPGDRCIQEVDDTEWLVFRQLQAIGQLQAESRALIRELEQAHALNREILGGLRDTPNPSARPARQPPKPFGDPLPPDNPPVPPNRPPLTDRPDTSKV